MKDVSLKILKRLRNSTYLFSKGILKMLLGCLRICLFGSCFCNFLSMIFRNKRYYYWKLKDFESPVSLSLRRFATFWIVPSFSESIDVLRKLFVFVRPLIKNLIKVLRKSLIRVRKSIIFMFLASCQFLNKKDKINYVFSLEVENVCQLFDEFSHFYNHHHMHKEPNNIFKMPFKNK